MTRMTGMRRDPKSQPTASPAPDVSRADRALGTLDRRELIKLLGGSMLATGLLGCTDRAPTLETLLGLAGEETQWIADLSADEQAELAQALTEAPGVRPTPRTLDLVARVLSSRSRLFRYVEYPDVADSRSVCDGLIRE